MTVVFLCTTVDADVITSFDAHGEKKVVLTFDACETKTPSHFDPLILDYLIQNKIPATFFVSAKFALRNPKRLAEVSAYPFIEIENHSYHHYAHMESLSKEEVQDEILSTQKIIEKTAKVKTKYFRFPAGNYDKKTLNIVEDMGYKVVHWSFASGDPDKKISAEAIIKWVSSATKPGSILIFHINGRGYTTPKTLPVIVENLKKRGFHFVRLDETL